MPSSSMNHLVGRNPMSSEGLLEVVVVRLVGHPLVPLLWVLFCAPSGSDRRVVPKIEEIML
jgi:hypothetical protein